MEICLPAATPPVKPLYKKYAVYYIEEFVYSPEEDGYSLTSNSENVHVIVPNLNTGIQGKQN